jgi:hypothetical protein
MTTICAAIRVTRLNVASLSSLQQEEYIKDEMRNLKRELVRAKEVLAIGDNCK